MRRTRWAILGPGEISGFFARALPRSEHGVLHGVGSSDPDRASAFAREYGAAASGSSLEVLSRDDIDAVYIGTVHTGHADLAVAALEAGKAVLCEKPVSPTVRETDEVLATAARAGRPFLEAYKYRFGPLAAEIRGIVERGEIGRMLRLDASMGFHAAPRRGRLFDPALAGGAILDVGCYPASLAVGIASWAGLKLGAAVSSVAGVVGDTGVDEWAQTDVVFGDFIASVATSIDRDLPRTAVLRGTEGTIDLSEVWGTRERSGASVVVQRAGEGRRRIEVSTVDPLAAEADAVSLALAEGRVEVPEMTWAESAAIARVLADWRDGID